jgi:histidinol-phosphate aminotransferase
MKELLSAYGEYVGADSQRLVAGDGSDELIALIINTFLCDGGKILICEPDFSMYRFYSEFSGCEIVSYKKKDGMDIDFSELSALAEKEDARLVIISNPCNPTGVMYDRKTVLDFVDSLNAVAVIDEAYMEFAPKSESVIADTEKRENLIVLKTVSKIGLAGLRCGFAVSNKEIISALKKTKSPYNMNTVTQAAVSAAIKEFSAFKENIEKIKDGVRYLYKELKPLEEKLKFSIRESSANFVFLRFSDKDVAEKIKSNLKSKGISVRNTGSGMRITAGTEKENEALVKEFKNTVL